MMNKVLFTSARYAELNLEADSFEEQKTGGKR